VVSTGWKDHPVLSHFGEEELRLLQPNKLTEDTMRYTKHGKWVVKLHYRGYTDQQISRILGIPAKSVREYLFRYMVNQEKHDG
jgi:hypothetical protein